MNYKFINSFQSVLIEDQSSYRNSSNMFVAKHQSVVKKFGKLYELSEHFSASYCCTKCYSFNLRCEVVP